MFFKKEKHGSMEVLKELLIRSVISGGYLKSSDLKKFYDAEQTKELLSSMVRDGVVTVNVIGSNEFEYMFSTIPEKYQPVLIHNLGEFDQILTEMGMNAEDGQIFLSEIIFAFDMEYSDIIEAFELYSQNSWVTKNISKSGNVYLMFDKDEFQRRQF